jgi:tRNA (cmo5U34)-methyltransferase
MNDGLRPGLFQWIYQGFNDGGVLIVTEKVLTNNSHINRFFINLYYEFKRRIGYSEHEILRKREDLENVLSTSAFLHGLAMEELSK